MKEGIFTITAICQGCRARVPIEFAWVLNEEGGSATLSIVPLQDVECGNVAEEELAVGGTGPD